jgi:hypothetical protein
MDKAYPALTSKLTSFSSTSFTVKNYSAFVRPHNYFRNAFLDHTPLFAGSTCYGLASRRCNCCCRLKEERLPGNLHFSWPSRLFVNSAVYASVNCLPDHS